MKLHPTNKEMWLMSRPYVQGQGLEKNQWNNPEWAGHICMVSGSGKYRFNQYGTTGFAHWQHRFKTKDAAIEWLSRSTQMVQRVYPDHPQYEVRTYYLD